MKPSGDSRATKKSGHKCVRCNVKVDRGLTYCWGCKKSVELNAALISTKQKNRPKCARCGQKISLDHAGNPLRWQWCGDVSRQCHLCGADWPCNKCPYCLEDGYSRGSCSASLVCSFCGVLQERITQLSKEVNDDFWKKRKMSQEVQQIQLPYPFERQGKQYYIDGWSEAKGYLMVREKGKQAVAWGPGDVEALLTELQFIRENIPQRSKQPPSNEFENGVAASVKKSRPKLKLPFKYYEGDKLFPGNRSLEVALVNKKKKVSKVIDWIDGWSKDEPGALLLATSLENGTTWSKHKHTIPAKDVTSFLQAIKHHTGITIRSVDIPQPDSRGYCPYCKVMHETPEQCPGYRAKQQTVSKGWCPNCNGWRVPGPQDIPDRCPTCNSLFAHREAQPKAKGWCPYCKDWRIPKLVGGSPCCPRCSSLFTNPPKHSVAEFCCCGLPLNDSRPECAVCGERFSKSSPIVEMSKKEWKEFQRWKQSSAELKESADECLTDLKDHIAYIQNEYSDYSQDNKGLVDRCRRVPRLIRYIMTGKKMSEMVDDDEGYYDNNYDDDFVSVPEPRYKVQVKIVDISDGKLIPDQGTIQRTKL